MIWRVLPRLVPLLSTRLLWEIEGVDGAVIRITNWNYYIMRRGPCQEGSHSGCENRDNNRGGADGAVQSEVQAAVTRSSCASRRRCPAGLLDTTMIRFATPQSAPSPAQRRPAAPAVPRPARSPQATGARSQRSAYRAAPPAACAAPPGRPVRRLLLNSGRCSSASRPLATRRGWLHFSRRMGREPSPVRL